MRTLRHPRGPIALAVIAAATMLWSGCSTLDLDPPTAPAANLQAAAVGQVDVRAAIAAQQRHTPALLKIPGVVGTAVGLLPGGQVGVRIFVLHSGVPGLPAMLDDVPARAEVTGRFVARSDPTSRLRPAPIGFSVGHPDITAGTIGARVVDGSGNLYILSNNHVLANSNNATPGDPTLQPGPYDGGTLADQVATLASFRPIDFSLSGQNTIDAAIALTSAANVGNGTGSDGYGVPSSGLYGDANADGVFDNIGDLLGLNVQKYGRTTRLTHGSITGINATVEVCYEVLFVFCIQSAYFVDQLIVEPGAFSSGGDSGSLLVTDDAGLNPVALLFAGSETYTIANRIDHVLNYFAIQVDGSAPGPPPPPVALDIGVASVSAPGSVTQGDAVDVVVTIQNLGTQDVTTGFDLTLRDETDDLTIGTQAIAGLAAGASTSRTFVWTTAASSLGSHTLTASHPVADENLANDQRSTVSIVSAPSVDVHIGNLDGIASDDGTTWSAIVEITVHDAAHTPINGATVVGTWSRNGLASDTCTTGDLGGDGTCIVLFPGLRRNAKFVTFRVTSVTMPGNVYDAGANHDVDGSSDGTTVRVDRP